MMRGGARTALRRAVSERGTNRTAKGRPMRRCVFACLALTLFASSASAQSWHTYTNARFGTTADVPRDWTAGQEPENGDGLVFTSPDGQSTIIISGGLHVEG